MEFVRVKYKQKFHFNFFKTSFNQNSFTAYTFYTSAWVSNPLTKFGSNIWLWEFAVCNVSLSAVQVQKICHALTQIPLFVPEPAVFALFSFFAPRFLMLPVVGGAKRAVGQSGGTRHLKANFLSTAHTPPSFQSSTNKKLPERAHTVLKRDQWKFSNTFCI